MANNAHKLATMPRAEARIFIAKEVLRLVESGFLRPTKGSWLGLSEGISADMNGSILLRELVQRQAYVTACARGAVDVVLLLQQEDSAVTWDAWWDREPKGYADPFFSRAELREIEVAFEHWDAPNYPTPPEDGLGTNPQDRMRSVMQNIIDNEKFMPPPWQLEVQAAQARYMEKKQ